MDQEKIVELINKVKEATQETKILYELSEAELIIFSTIVTELPIGAMSGKLLGRLLRAAAHFIERNEEIAREYAQTMRKG